MQGISVTDLYLKYRISYTEARFRQLLKGIKHHVK